MTRRSLGLVATVGVAALLCGASRASAQTSPDLGRARTYSILAGTQVTNTGATTIVSGDVGISPGAGAVGANHPGLTAAMVVGTIHDKDVPAADAQFDKNAAYTQLDLLNGCTVTYAGAFKELAGSSLVPGVYCATSFRLSGGILTLAGLASDTWVFKSSSDLIISGGAATRVASPSCNVWWRVVSTASFDAGSSLLGNILADTSITLAANASLSGKALARTAEVTLSSNAIAACTPNLAAVVPPTVAKAFSPGSITPGGVSRLTITVSNANAAAIALTAAFTDTLPTGVLVAPTPNPTTTCGVGAVTAPAGGSTVTLATGSTIPAAGSCVIAVNVTAAAVGTFVNTIPAGALQTSSGNNAAPATATLIVAAATCPVITLAPPTLPAGRVGVAYSQQITASGGTGTSVFAVTSGTLPAGLTLSSGGLLSGTPTTAGSSTVTISATDGNGCPGLITYTIVIGLATPAVCPVITLAPLTAGNGTVGVAYSLTLTGSGGTAPLTFGVTGGALPAGLVLTPAGVLSGTPSAGGIFTFTVRGTDATGCFAELTFVVPVAAAVPTLPQAFVLLLALGLMAIGYLRLRQRGRTE